MNKKSAVMFSILGIIIVLICIPLIYVEKRRAYYDKWGELAVLAETDDRAKYIIDNPGMYSEKILKYFYENPDEFDFVYNYAFHKDDYIGMDYSSDELNSKSIPALYMDDPRWRYQTIGGDYIRDQGCVAVSLTMAYLHLAGKGDTDPYKIGLIAEEVDGIGVFGGITDEKIPDICGKLGLKVETYRYSENREKTSHADIELIKSLLDKGHVVMAGMAGDTFGVHVIIIKGYSDDVLFINDSASPENTEKSWAFDEIEPELMYLYDISI